MAKTRLSAASKKWFKGSTLVQQPTTQPDNSDKNSAKMKVTLYVSKAAWRILWRRRAETGVTLSKTFEELVIKHLGELKTT